ncbi:MAG: lasso peptide biosynthesis B2 protein [Steroidobacteraceae bacterium]
MPRQYAICQHAYTCLSGGHIVFLDLERDKYLCLDLAATAALLPYLSGRSFVIRDPPPDRPADIAHTLTELEQRNLIALVPLGYTTPNVAQIARPTRSISAPVGDEYHCTATDACKVFLAVTRSALMLRWRPLEKNIAHVTQRRKSAAAARVPAGLETLVQRFASCRSRFDRVDACLPNSLALLEFLALHGLYPNLVFGVSMRPFHAHCWVQHEDTVLGDTLEHINQFTPIMVA